MHQGRNAVAKKDKLNFAKNLQSCSIHRQVSIAVVPGKHGLPHISSLSRAGPRLLCAIQCSGGAEGLR